MQLIQDRAQIISYRSFTEKQTGSNLLIAESVCDQADDLLFPLADIMLPVVKRRAGLDQFRDFGYDFMTKNSLPGINSPEGRKDAGIILFQKVSLGAKLQRADDILVIGKGGEKENPGIRKFFQYFCGCIQAAYLFHSDIHKKYVRMISAE